jgi:hypothetical protein
MWTGRDRLLTVAVVEAAAVATAVATAAATAAAGEEEALEVIAIVEEASVAIAAEEATGTAAAVVAMGTAAEIVAVIALVIALVGPLLCLIPTPLASAVVSSRALTRGPGAVRAR